MRYTPTQIQAKLREAERQLTEGVPLSQVCKALGVSRATYYRWVSQNDPSPAPDSTHVRCLEGENELLRQIVIDLLLELKSAGLEKKHGTRKFADVL